MVCSPQYWITIVNVLKYQSLNSFLHEPFLALHSIIYIGFQFQMFYSIDPLINYDINLTQLARVIQFLMFYSTAEAA
jgi:hypothetical protein